MNVSNTKLSIFVLLLTLFSIKAYAIKTIKWTPDGSVSINNREIKLDLQNAYSAYEYNGDIFILGFKINNNKNQPTVVRVYADATSPQYWSFSKIIRQIFEIKNKPYLLDMDGSVYRLESNFWNQTPIKLEAKSIILDTENGILACYPSSLFKANKTIGACYMADKKWTIKANWRQIEPKICGDYLIITDIQGSKVSINKHLKSDGKLISTNTVKKLPKDLCQVKFN